MKEVSLNKIHNFNILEHVSSDLFYINFDNYDEDTIIEEFKNIYLKMKENNEIIKESEIKHIFLTATLYSYQRFITVISQTEEVKNFIKNNEQFINYLSNQNCVNNFNKYVVALGLDK
jgi:hypothetical protein